MFPARIFEAARLRFLVCLPAFFLIAAASGYGSVGAQPPNIPFRTGDDFDCDLEEMQNLAGQQNHEQTTAQPSELLQKRKNKSQQLTAEIRRICLENK